MMQLWTVTFAGMRYRDMKIQEVKTSFKISWNILLGMIFHAIIWKEQGDLC